MKKLNRKGFTLIELLAVIVILAIVMGIGANSVLTTMNNSRKGSLTDLALVYQDAFNTAYVEAQVTGASTILGISTNNLKNGTLTPLTSTTLKEMNTSEDDIEAAKSYVQYNTSTQKFSVCLTAKSTGKYMVTGAVKSSDVTLGGNVKLAKETMYSCVGTLNSGNPSW